MKAFALHLYLGAVFEVVAEANRYFANSRAVEARQERSRADAPRALHDDRNAAHRGDPAAAGDAGRDGQVARSARRRRRTSARLRRVDAGDEVGRFAAPHRLRPGAPLPAPAPVFPRYVEPEAARGGRVDAHRQPLPPRLSRFRRRMDEVVARARAAGVERLMTISTRVAAAPRLSRDRRALRRRSISPSEPIRIRRPRNPRRTRRRSAPSPRIPNASGSARRGSTTITIMRRPTSPSACFARRSASRASSACRSSFTPARPTTTSPRSCARKWRRGRSRRCCTVSPRRARSRRPGLELGLYVSFSGVLTFKNSRRLRAIARDVPMDRVLVETDAPFLAPVPHRGRRNEPAFVVDTARVLAEVKGVDAQTIAAATRANTLRLFSKMRRGQGVSFALTILGCGSSGGVPRVAQGWGACDPANPRNRRRRCSVLLERDGRGGQDAGADRHFARPAPAADRGGGRSISTGS